MNIGVVEENGKIDAGAFHFAHNIGGARRATGMQQHALLVAGNRQPGAVQLGFGLGFWSHQRVR